MKRYACVDSPVRGEGRPTAFAPSALRRVSPKLAQTASERRRKGLRYRHVMNTVLVVLVLDAIISAQQSPPTAFRFERPIVTNGQGPRRLAIDVPLLAGASPFRVVSRAIHPATREPLVSVAGGLNDLRLYDANGTEIGYLLVQPPSTLTVYKQAVTLPVASVDTEKLRTSGFEADAGEPLLVDRLRIDGLLPPFVKRVTLEGSGDREHWTMLVAEATLFDLPEERLKQTELRFKPGSFRYLRLTWDDTNSARLPRPAAVAVGQVPQSAPPPPLTTPVVVERRASEPRRSRFRLHLPAGHLPVVALDLDVGGGHVMRAVSVFEPRLSGAELEPVLLGQATVRRVVRDGVAASALRVAIDLPTEAQLDLVVDDGDNPPLDLRGVRAVFAELPWIYFESPAGGVTARYGNAQLRAPRYDLEAIRARIHIEAVADADWGEARALSAEENAGAAPALPTVGAGVDPDLFKYVRPIPAGNAGLVSLDLDAGVLAHSAGVQRGFADVRVIDGDGRQIPYLIERASEPLAVNVAVERLAAPPSTLPRARAGQTVYRVKLPYAGLPAARLVLTTSARVFDRTMRVAVEREPDRRRRDRWLDTVAAARWVQANQDRPAPPVEIALPPLTTSEVLLIVDEGDNAPLPLGAAHLLLPSYRLRLYRGAGAALRLTYGRADLDRPHYDLALLAPQVLGTPATDVSPGTEQPSGSRPATAAIISPRVFWTALSVAVVVLVGLIGRLLKKEQA